jgi:Ca2+-binding EF-hand superfamily protein
VFLQAVKRRAVDDKKRNDTIGNKLQNDDDIDNEGEEGEENNNNNYKKRKEPTTLDLESFFAHFSIPRTPLNERIFHVMDGAGTGELTFLQFSLTLWNYLTLGHRALIRLSFSLLDPDNTGFVSFEDLGELIGEVHGGDWQSLPRMKPVAMGVARIAAKEGDNDGTIGLKAFEKILGEYPALLFPAYSAQLRLREAILGKSYWEKEQKKREDLSKLQAEKSGRKTSSSSNAAYSLWDVVDALVETAADGEVGADIQRLRKERFVPERVNKEKGREVVPSVEATGLAAKEKAALRRRELHGGLRTAEALQEDAIVGDDSRLYDRASAFEARVEEVSARNQ